MPSFDCAPEYIQKNHYYTQTGSLCKCYIICHGGFNSLFFMKSIGIEFAPMVTAMLPNLEMKRVCCHVSCKQATICNTVKCRTKAAACHIIMVQN